MTEIPDDVMKVVDKCLRSDDLRSAIASAIMDERKSVEWQPIDTAPKDGTHCIIWLVPYYSPAVAYWKDDGWFIGGYRLGISAVTHWRNIPYAPSVAREHK